MRVLICEDEEIILKTLIYKLQFEGFTASGVCNGREAMEELRYNDYDLILSDVLMPFHSGFEVLNYVRKQLKKDIPFVFLSKTGSKETIELAYEMGASYFMLKPFDPEELVFIIKKILKINTVDINAEVS